jgi:glycosyltransferase involved in cell wall biosynthesis
VALILPSGREGLARSVMEALALGVPVVASTARGNRELVGDGSGFIVPTGDVATLGERMDWLIEHPEERRAMGLEGRRRMRDTFDLRHVLALHDGLYRDLLSEARQRQLRADLTASRAR